ncbi:MAG: glycosyltransferase family 4 protein [Candidatus Sericytochromatia bacterium]|nr:glycosyltransferase family 4 protein [Candidatus Sericytochromatia bacterium]
MRIALLAPIQERCPPEGYGGIERVVALLAEGLCARGHRVTLFASGDSRTSAHLSGTEATALRPRGLSIPEQRLRDLRHVGAALARAEEFDVIHNHHGPMPLGLDTGAAPILTTLHGPMTPEHRQPFEGQHPCVAISRHQATHATGVRVLGVVHNGVDVAALRHHRVAEDVLQPHEWGRALVFLGRISPEKGPHLAIRTGQRLGLPVVLAGKIDPVDRAYAESAVLPHVDGVRVRWVGEVGGARKATLLRGALAMLHPVRWPEPFGLVLVEAMAAGTPVVALAEGAIPEIVEHGVTGWVGHDPEDLETGVRKVADMDRAPLPGIAARRFSPARMTRGYESLYDQLLDGRS